MQLILGVLLASLVAIGQAKAITEVSWPFEDLNYCQICVNDFDSSKQPLVIKYDEKRKGFFHFDEPDEGDSMIYAPDELVMLSCPGGRVLGTMNSEVQLNCVGVNNFVENIHHEERPFENFKCDSQPESTLRRTGECHDGKSGFAIGFEVNRMFLKIIDICFDETINMALYAKHTLSTRILGAQHHGFRLAFKKGNLFQNILVDTAYTRATQKTTFSELLPDTDVDQYINNDKFLEIGHLAPRADFIFDAQQGATSYHVNAGPQWNTFNNGNWKKLEGAIRYLIIEKYQTFTIYTGTYGTYEINHTKMYLAKDSSGQYTMPIPLIFWKVVIDNDSKKAVAFIGLNDPYAELENNPAKLMCAIDVCSRINWFVFSQTPKNGLIYCCTLRDFTNAVKNFPPTNIDYELLN